MRELGLRGARAGQEREPHDVGNAVGEEGHAKLHRPAVLPKAARRERVAADFRSAGGGERALSLPSQERVSSARPGVIWLARALFVGHGLGMLRSLVCVSVLLGLVAACASGDPAGAASAEVAGAELGTKTVTKGSIAAGQTVKVEYAPAAYPSNVVPFLALTVDADGGAPVTRVTVGGEFPSTPHLLVVDPSFAVLAETEGVRTAHGAEATLALPASAGPARMILVQDPQWAVSMTFDVTAE